MSATTEIDVCVLWDSVGDHGIGKDEAGARENYENDVQPLSDADGFRILRMKLTVPNPEILEASVAIPATDETVSVKVGV